MPSVSGWPRGASKTAPFGEVINTAWIPPWGCVESMLWSPSPDCEECVLWMLRVGRRDVREVPRCQSPTPERRDVQTGTAWGCLSPNQTPDTEQGARMLFPSPQSLLPTGLPENPHLQTLEFRGVIPGQSCGSGRTIIGFQLSLRYWLWDRHLTHRSQSESALGLLLGLLGAVPSSPP